MTIREQLAGLAGKATWRILVLFTCELVEHAKEALLPEEKESDYAARVCTILKTARNWTPDTDIGPALAASRGVNPYHHRPDRHMGADWYLYLAAQQLAWILDAKTVNASRLEAAADAARDSVSRSAAPRQGDRARWLDEGCWQIKGLSQLVYPALPKAEGRLRNSLLAS